MGFSADWLALREPADLAARDDGLLRRAVQAAGPEPVILDLGCGTGATVRAMAPHLPEGTRWHLVDHDADLLSHAASVLAGHQVETHQRDLAAPEELPLDGVTLVTASALLDLVSEAWIRRLAALLRVPVYAALSYDGQMGWSPEDARDKAVTEAFNGHQRGEKGFGPALGPDAVRVGAAVFAEAGFEVHEADSPWHLGPDMAGLHAQLVEGIAAAAGEAGCDAACEWGGMRVAEVETTTCTIGHGDLLALPRATTKEVHHAPD
jgi:SAM-dependent methyltransferase